LTAGEHKQRIPGQQENRSKYLDNRRTKAKNNLTAGKQKQIIPRQQENRSKEYLAAGKQKQRIT
jgi:hypothetical protein